MDILLIIICTAIYFIPSFVGFKKSNFNSIVLLNIFLGWTLIGWVVALVWASTNEKKEVVVINSEKSKSVSGELAELKKLYDDGVLNKLEFEKLKKKLLD